MSSRSVLVGVACVMALAGPLSGCAGKIRLSSKTMCEAHGGSYSSQTKQCSHPAQASSQNAAQICQTMGGTSDPVSEECVFDERTR